MRLTQMSCDLITSVGVPPSYDVNVERKAKVLVHNWVDCGMVALNLSAIGSQPSVNDPLFVSTNCPNLRWKVDIHSVFVASEARGDAKLVFCLRQPRGF